MRSNIDGESYDDCIINHDDNTLVRKVSNVGINGDNCVDGNAKYYDDVTKQKQKQII